MGFDLYGLNPINTTNVQKPIIDWTANPSDEERDRYFKEMETYEKAVPGDYFRNNVWYWQPLWKYICMICDDILTNEESLPITSKVFISYNGNNYSYHTCSSNSLF